MAKILDNPKGFYVIEMSDLEVNACFGSCGICDYCNTKHENGYYISVLNSWYCPKCYQEWIKRAKRYREDIGIETKNFEIVKRRLGL